MSEQWKYSIVGGSPRVKIETADEIKRLPELDPKLWTVLSCPVCGLELEEKSLTLLDSNKDGAIHINEINDIAKYLSRVLNGLDILLTEGDDLPLSAINRNDADGEKIAALMESRGMEKALVGDADAMLADLDAEIKAKVDAATQATQENLPFGDKTEAVDKIIAAVEDKVDDYFARCAVARYADNAEECLDVKVSDVEAIASGLLSEECEALEKMPLGRVGKDSSLSIYRVNPAWKNRIEALRREVLVPMFGDIKKMSDEQWKTVKDQIGIYRAWVAGKEKAEAAVLETEKALTERRTVIEELRKLVMLRRDFYRLLCNYVTFTDFYGNERKAIFQVGELYIDQRCCSLCMKVENLDRSVDQARHTGMFLIYCRCESKTLGKSMNIVAALTSGSVRNIRVGTHALFFDRQGNDYDATVVHIIDNPISIKQAFYMPYRKFIDFIENQVSKIASAKEQKVLDEASSKIDTSTENIQKATEVVDKQLDEERRAKKQAFDIAKFCGIFAAIGMAIGYIGGFLTSAFTGFINLRWWQMPIAIAGVMLLISGPSMVLAWLKLRKRNLSPLLNANGWAMNTALIISIIFGNTLTKTASFPKLNIPDIKFEGLNGLDNTIKKSSSWWKWLILAIVIVVVMAGLMFLWIYWVKSKFGLV